ncbi:MAG: hypothetical protein GF353_26980 [Candidatus Lokiarchaeota archaeon]|nr:hypothetical protein [Candidatus Lokiarchaeota archaeon]
MFFCKLTTRLKDISAIEPLSFLANRSKALRAHPINWVETTEPEGFTHLNYQLRDLDAYQFNISKERGRIHGFLIEHIFYVIWIDSDHNLYE